MEIQDNIAKSFMLCESITEEQAKTTHTDINTYVGQRKLDGTRIISVVLNGDVILFNRRGKICNFHFPEVVEDMKKFEVGIYDGEIISLDDDFNALMRRAMTKTLSKLPQLIKDVPIKYVVFDILKRGDKDVRNNTMIERYNILKDIFDNMNIKNKCKSVELIETLPVLEMLEKAHIEDREGIIIKTLKGRYEGRRSHEWIKCKFFLECVLTVIKYDINPRGITVEDNLGNRVAVLGEQSQEVITLIDKNKQVDINIQFLERTAEGRYRFPSFRGLKE